MDFGRIVSRSFQIAWKHKFLWVFGMFASMSFNLNFQEFSDNSEISNTNLPAFHINPDLLLPYLFSFMLFGIVLFIISIIANIGLIDSVNRIERGGKYGFSIAYSAGLDYFWRFLIIFLICGFGLVLIGFVSTMLLVSLFKIHLGLGLLSLIFFIPFFFFMIFVFVNLLALSSRVLVVRNCSIMDAIYEGYILLKDNFKDNVIIFLIFFGLSIALGIATLIIWAIFSLPISFIIMSTGVEMFYAFIFGFILGLPVSLVMGGYIGTFQSSLYTLFYFELVEPKTVIKESMTQPDESGEPLI